MSEFNLFTILALAVVCFSASTLSTAIGFGMNIILLSIFQFLLPPVQLVAMATALGLANAMIRMVGLRHIDTRGATGRILIAGILGVPCGTAVLLLAPADLMKLFFSALVIVSALMLVMPSSIGASHGAMPRVKQGQILFGALGGFPAAAVEALLLHRGFDKLRLRRLATGLGSVVEGLAAVGYIRAATAARAAVWLCVQQVGMLGHRAGFEQSYLEVGGPDAAILTSVGNCAANGAGMWTPPLSVLPM